ncbi:leucine-rich repeat-containing protein 23 isoform 1-T1 [Geothlypis trichas]
MEDEEEQEEGEEKEEDEEKEKEDEVKEKEDEEPPPCPLTEEHFKEGLSLLCKTGNGLAHAYVKFEAKDKGLTDISLLERFIHLRYVDLSKNKLKDLAPLSSLTQLLWLKVDRNLLTSASMQELPYLQVISFDRNHIVDFEGITHPLLTNLSLKENKIETVLGLSHDHLFSLQVLELRGNKINTTAGLGVSKLKKLYLAKNTICSLEGLEEFEQLEILHLRDNKLEALDGFSASMKCLQYLNLRDFTTCMGLLALLSVLLFLQEQWDQKLSGGGKAAGAAHAAGAGADGQSVCPRTRLPTAGPVLAATAAAPRQGNSRGRGAGRGRENPTDKEGKRKRKGNARIS